VSSTGRRPMARSRPTASGDVGLTVSATISTPRTAPSQATKVTVWPLASAASAVRASSDGIVSAHSPVSQVRRPARMA
jgi:hypothetical protein